MWNDKQEAHGPEDAGETSDLNDSPEVVAALLSHPTPHESASSESTMAGPSQETTPSIGEYDYMFNFDQDPLFGLDFWSYLAGMPNTQPGVNESCKSLPFD